MTAPIYILTSSVGGFPFPYPLLAIIIFRLLMIAILTGVRWYLIEVLICNSLITSNVEHLFMALVAIWMTFWKECIFRSSAHFLVGCWFFQYWVYELFGFLCGKSLVRYGVILYSYFKLTFNFGIVLDLLKSCKDSTKCSHKHLISFPLLLASYVPMVHLSKLNSQHWYIIITRLHTLFRFH